MRTDTDHIRRKALLAASSVVLAMGLVACPTIDKGDEDDDGGETATDSGGITGDDAGGTDTAAMDTGSDKPTCVGVEDPELYEACCNGLREWCEEVVGSDEEAINECVYGPDFDGSTGCIPWGPPVPPQARHARRLLA